MLRKSGYDGHYFYKHESPDLEIDFFWRKSLADFWLPILIDVSFVQ